jgi:hypothetical protein
LVYQAYAFTHFNDGRITNVLEVVGNVVQGGDSPNNLGRSAESGEPPRAKEVMVGQVWGLNKVSQMPVFHKISIACLSYTLCR